MGDRTLTSKAVSSVYYKACDKYYHWYVHEDTGFRLSRKDLIFYSATFWVYACSEEVYWLAHRAGVSDEALVPRIASGLIVGSAIMFMYLNWEIKNLKRKHEETNE